MINILYIYIYIYNYNTCKSTTLTVSQEEGCESKLEAIAKSQERLRKNSEDLEMKALKFDEEKRKLEAWSEHVSIPYPITILVG